jgi:hypothetical protein
MVVAVPAYGIPPALRQLVVEPGLGSLWLPLVLNFSCRVHCLYLLWWFLHAGLGSLGCRGSSSLCPSQEILRSIALLLAIAAGNTGLSIHLLR